jgi:hypothetical protein
VSTVLTLDTEEEKALTGKVARRSDANPPPSLFTVEETISFSYSGIALSWCCKDNLAKKFECSQDVDSPKRIRKKQ